MSANFDAPTLGRLMAAVNQEIDRFHTALGLPESNFFCECGSVACHEQVTHSRAEYASLREAPHPLVVAAHAHGEPSQPDDDGRSIAVPVTTLTETTPQATSLPTM